MIAFLQYVAALIVLATADPAAGPDAPRWAAIAATLVGFAVLARAAGLALARRGPERRRFEAFLFALDAGRVAALAAFWAVVVPLGGARVPEALGFGDWPILPRLVQLLPFVVLTTSVPWGLHPAAASLRLGARSAARAAASELRDALLPAGPVFVAVALESLPRLAGSTSALGRAVKVLLSSPALYAFFTLGVLLLMLLAFPFVLRLLLRAKPLPAGPLRGRLEAYARRVGFRARDILLLPTDGDVLNAAVVGAFPRFRYVVVTDGLLKTLEEDEIEAVFAHEAGHARRGHVLLFLGFTAVLALVRFVPGLGGVVGLASGTLLGTLLLLGLWLGVVMGWISRRFEQEADVFGIETLPRSAADEDHPFARALARIGSHVGEIREVTGWRHFSIDDRVRFVRDYLADADVRRAYRRSISLLRGTLLLVVCGFALVAAARIPGELADAPAKWADAADPEQFLLAKLHQALLVSDRQARAADLRDAGVFAAAAGRADDAARLLRESAALGPKDAATLVAYATLLERTGRPIGARLVWRELSERPDVDEKVRGLARNRAASDVSR